MIEATSGRQRATRSSADSTWRLLAAFVLGCLAAGASFAFGIPGKGEFLPTIWLAGFVALLVAPGRRGLLALIAGVTITAALLDLSDGVFGLVFLIVAIVAALASHGALSASVLLRMKALGWTASRRDARVIIGGTIALVAVVALAWIAYEFARNPP